MKLLPLLIVMLPLLACDAGTTKQRLPDVRRSLRTVYRASNTHVRPPASPPPKLFDLIRYDAPLGENAAYVSPTKEGEKRPAMIWIHGGFNFGIFPYAWEEAERENDQSSRAYLHDDLVLMLPSLRGTNDNPGDAECLLGEVDDVIAAANYLKSRPDVDPNRIYLGGHSTGGTLSLLVAESTDLFRAVFSFGPAGAVAQYNECIPHDAPFKEQVARSPMTWINEITSKTFIIEGGWNEYDYLPYGEGSPIEVLTIPEADHFSILRPGNEVVLQTILADDGESPISMSKEQIRKRLQIKE